MFIFIHIIHKHKETVEVVPFTTRYEMEINTAVNTGLGIPLLQHFQAYTSEVFAHRAVHVHWHLLSQPFDLHLFHLHWYWKYSENVHIPETR
jgi:hypothetical protein